MAARQVLSTEEGRKDGPVTTKITCLPKVLYLLRARLIASSQTLIKTNACPEPKLLATQNVFEAYTGQLQPVPVHQHHVTRKYAAKHQSQHTRTYE